MYKRPGQRDIAGVINELVERIRKLETAAGTRVLPAGYRWSQGSDGSLVIIRESDDSETVIVSG